jgi:hypothetical protein
MFITFFLLVAGHYIADYPLQGDFLAKGKNRHTDIGKDIWPHCLFAHSMIHSVFVLFITGSLGLAVAELVMHAVTDFLKCEGTITLNQDQFIHILCKLIWAMAVVTPIAA